MDLPKDWETKDMLSKGWLEIPGKRLGDSTSERVHVALAYYSSDEKASGPFFIVHAVRVLGTRSLIKNIMDLRSDTDWWKQSYRSTLVNYLPRPLSKGWPIWMELNCNNRPNYCFFFSCFIFTIVVTRGRDVLPWSNPHRSWQSAYFGPGHSNVKSSELLMVRVLQLCYPTQ